MTLAIGEPGQPVRMFLDAVDSAQVDANISAGEVAVQVEAPGDFIISLDGHSVEPRPLPIEERQLAMWSAVKRKREKAEASGCTFLGHPVQTDMVSRSRIESGALQASIAALSGAPYSIVWTMADNENVPLDRNAMLDLNSAVSAHTQACKARERDLRAAIFAEGITGNQLDAIDIAQGWP